MNIKFKNEIKLYGLALILSITAFGVQAQNSNIAFKSNAFVETVVKNSKGVEEKTLSLADKVLPGQTVWFKNNFKNDGKQNATNIVITNPIPEHMIVSEVVSNKTDDILYSVDGGKVFAAENALFIKDAVSGKSKLASKEDYTHIRWVVKEILIPGAQSEVGFKARLK